MSRQFSFFLVLLSLLLLPGRVLGAFQHITVTTSVGVKEYGCRPSTFTSIPSSFDSFPAALSSPEDACYPEDYEADFRFWQLDNHDDINGKVALVRRCKTCNCYFENKAQAAVASGAEGVVIINDNLDAVIPVLAGQADQTYTSPVPVCMVTFDDGEEIISLLDSDEGEVTVSFEGVFPEDLGQVPEDVNGNFLTYLDVLTPWSIKFRYPAAMCLWNPVGDVSVDPITAKVVKAKISMHCPFEDELPSHSACYSKGCHVVGVDNPEEIAGNFALFSNFQGDEWCHDVQELSAAAQNAGAVGAIVAYIDLYSIPIFDAPKYSPYDYTIPTYILPGTYANNIATVVEDEDEAEDVIVRFPKYAEDAVHGIIPEKYFPVDEVLGSLPQTSVCLSSEDGADGRECFTAGQAIFNPLESGPLQAEMALAEIDASCHDEDMEAGKEGSGADCVSCMSLLTQDLAVTNRYSISGKIVLVKAAETFCINEWEDLIDNLVAHGALGMVVGNEFDYTYTMVDSQEVTSPIPVFNVRQSALSAMLSAYESSSEVTVSFPRVVSGAVVAKNVTSHHMSYDEFGLTQLDVVRPTRFSGVVEAGQANFNREFHSSDLMMLTLVTFYAFCSSELSCHKCNLLSTPLTSGFPHGGVAVIDMTTAACFQPIGTVIKFVQDAGAEAVVVVLEGQELVTLSNGNNAEIDAQLEIPVFNVARDTFADILEELQKGPYADMIKIRLPKISAVQVDGGGSGSGSGIGNSSEMENIYVADETIDEYDKYDYDGEVEDDSYAKGRQGGVISLKGGSKVGLTASLVVVLVVLVFVVGRALHKKREQNRTLMAYNRLQAGTQIGNPLGAGGDAPGGGDGNNANRHSAPTLSSVQQGGANDVIITARPWVPAEPSNKADFGMFGLLDFRNKESDRDGGMYGKMQGTVVEMTDVESSGSGMGMMTAEASLASSSLAGPRFAAASSSSNVPPALRHFEIDSDDDEKKPAATNNANPPNRRNSQEPLLD
mmetsp:Transcript_16695/g.31246  ORF Transcript_16695/g.31246 Transcript_16695/m.31246 type:complete len:999 (+) Transcript_16695:142-3138(+)